MSRYLIFAVAALTLLLQTMSQSAMAVAFPEITADFDVSIVLAGWVLNIAQLATVVSIPIAAKASDSFGRKRTFFSVVTLFTVGSFLCAIAPNIYWLILFRALQGAGAGGFVTSATGIVSDAFPESRQRAIGFIVTVLSAGLVMGPNLGGWLTQSYGWRYTFWYNLPLGVVVLVAGAILLKPDTKILKPHLDLAGAGLLTASMLGIMGGLTALGGRSFTTSGAMAALLLAAGVAVGAVFVRHEARVTDPLIDVRMLTGRHFAAASTFNLIFGVVFGMLTLLPLYAVTVYGVTTLQSGFIVTPRAIAMTAGSLACSFLLARWGYRKPLVIGTILNLVALILLGIELQGISLAGLAIGGITVTILAVGLSGLAQGFILPAANNASIDLMPERISTITGLRQSCRNVGSTVGIAVASVVLDIASSIPRGFTFVFFGMAVLSLVGIPSILAIPRSASEARPR